MRRPRPLMIRPVGSIVYPVCPPCGLREMTGATIGEYSWTTIDAGRWPKRMTMLCTAWSSGQTAPLLTRCVSSTYLDARCQCRTALTEQSGPKPPYTSRYVASALEAPKTRPLFNLISSLIFSKTTAPQPLNKKKFSPSVGSICQWSQSQYLVFPRNLQKQFSVVSEHGVILQASARVIWGSIVFLGAFGKQRWWGEEVAVAVECKNF